MTISVYLLDVFGRSCNRKITSFSDIPYAEHAILIHADQGYGNRFSYLRDLAGADGLFFSLGDVIISFKTNSTQIVSDSKLNRVYFGLVCYENIFASRIANFNCSSLLNNLLSLYALPNEEIRIYLRNHFDRLNDYVSFSNRSDRISDIIKNIDPGYRIKLR